MKNLPALVAALLLFSLCVAPAHAQATEPPPGAAAPKSTPLSPARTLALMNRVTSAYRAMQSYRGVANWTRKVGDRELTATVAVLMDRPGRYLLDVKGDGVNTIVADDGSTLLAIRPDRKAYTKAKAPLRIMGADVLAKVDVPSPGARIVTLLLENAIREPVDPLAKAFAGARAFGPQDLNGKPVYVLTFPYDAQHEARVYVGEGDDLVRRATLMRGSEPELVEVFDPVEVDKPIPAGAFTPALPDNAELVYVLPPLKPVQAAEAPPPAPDFTVPKADGSGEVRLADLKGKYVVLLFWTNDSQGSAEEFQRLVRLYNQYRNSGLEVVAVNGGDQPDAALQFAQGYGAKFPVAMSGPPAADTGAGSPKDILTLYNVHDAPTTFVLDTEGRIVARIGGFSARDRRIEVALSKAGLQMD